MTAYPPANPETSRALRCGSANARTDIVLHWRTQARLVEVRPGKWIGPCPKDGTRGALNVEAGRNGGVVWAVPGCKDRHDRAAAYPALKRLVPCAPDPGQQRNPELDALKDAVKQIVLNENFTHSNPIKLAVLEVLGYGTNDALTALSIIDAGNRRRTKAARDKALSPAKTVTNDSKRRSKAPKKPGPDGRSPRPAVPPAETRLPAATVTNDSPQLVTNDSPPSTAKSPLTSTFPGLTDRANVVSGPAGRDTDTTTALDLEAGWPELTAPVTSRGLPDWDDDTAGAEANQPTSPAEAARADRVQTYKALVSLADTVGPITVLAENRPAA